MAAWRLEAGSSTGPRSGLWTSVGTTVASAAPVPTPCCLLQTRRGSVPVLTPDLLQACVPAGARCATLGPHLLEDDLRAVLSRGGARGGVHGTCGSGMADYLLLFSTFDACMFRPGIPTGDTYLGVNTGPSGNKQVTVPQFLASAAASGSQLVECIADVVAPGTVNTKRLKKSLAR